MSGKTWVIPLMLALAACANGADRKPGPAAAGSGAEPVAMNAAAERPASRPSPSAAGWAVSVVGTPFAFAFKSVVCAASVVVAAPVAGFLALGLDPAGEGYQMLGDGIAQNCGPPYVVSPYAAS